MTYNIAVKTLESKKRAYKRQFDNYQDTGYTKYYNAYSNYEHQVEALEAWLELHDIRENIDKLLSTGKLSRDLYNEIMRR